MMAAAVLSGAAALVLVTEPAAATSVSDQTGFRAAWTNGAETQIDLSADITMVCTDQTLGNGVAVRNSSTAITLDGHGHTITQACSTGTNNGVLESDGTGTVTIQNVTITGGNTTHAPGGGGVLSQGPLTLSNCTVSNNQVNTQNSNQINPNREAGGGVAALGGSLTISSCTLSGNTATGAGEVGGAAVHDGGGSLSITDTALTGNTGSAGTNSDAAGGVVNNSGSTTITRSSITSNHGTGVNVGGGVVNESGSETTINSTISGNTASGGSTQSNLGAAGGILNQGGGETLVYDTLDGNTGVTGAANDAANYVNQGGQVHWFATVVGDPSGGPNCTGGSFVSNGHNLEDDTAHTCGLAAATQDIVGQSPQLGAIANNGGPTLTQLPQSGSPLIDAVPTASCQADGAAGVTTDQRGFSRPQGNGCDTGAVEVQAAPSGCVTGSHAGSVSLAAGRNACVNGASITGSLVIPSGTNATITNSSIGGSIVANDAGTLTLCNSHVGGNLSDNSATGFVVVGDPVDDGCPGNSINGSAQFNSDRAGVEVGHNTIGGSLVLNSDSGGGPFAEDTNPEVEANTIKSNLACSNDSPAATNGGQPNSVAGTRSGECVAA